MITTTREPKLKMGEVKALTVISVQGIGAFLDWGLEKDLFLPYKEQIGKVREQDEILVRLYTDKSRLRRRFISKGKRASVLIQQLQHLKGVLIHLHIGLFPRSQIQFPIGFYAGHPGIDTVSNPKKTVILMTGNQRGIAVIHRYKRTEIVAELIDPSLHRISRLIRRVGIQYFINLFHAGGGALPFTDKASPELILQETKMSKNAFKRAVGRLYKERQIEITKENIRKL